MASFVDPIINATVFSDVDLRRDLISFFQLDFPESWLPTFLHEGTHHACFMSPVGTTLALLRMRSYRQATLMRSDEDGVSEWDLLEDVLRQEVTMELLRPLSEGLACFAELDSVPGKSNVLTAPMSSTFFYFGKPEDELKSESNLRKNGIDFFLFSLLYHVRTSEDVARRREAVLSAKFSSSFGGHLAGYMSIKALWQRARISSDLAHDAELFSAYVRSYFFDDYGFVATILDNSASEHVAANAISSYFQNRVSQLMSMDWESALQAYARTHQNVTLHDGPSGKHVHTAPHGLNNDRPSHCLGLARLDALIHELYDDDHSDMACWAMRKYDLRRLQKRELLCMGSLDVKVVVNEYDRVLVYSANGKGAYEQIIFACAAKHGTQAGESIGSVEFYLIPSEHSRALAVVRGSEVVFEEFKGPIGEARRQQMSNLFGARSIDLKTAHEQESNLERVIADSEIRFVRNQARKTIPEGVDRFYSLLATINVPVSKMESTSRNLMEAGLLGLCDGDDEFIHGLAFLGAAGSVIPDKSRLAQMSAHLQIDIDSICRKADLLRSSTGIATIVEVNEVLVTLL